MCWHACTMEASMLVLWAGGRAVEPMCMWLACGLVCMWVACVHVGWWTCRGGFSTSSGRWRTVDCGGRQRPPLLVDELAPVYGRLWRVGPYPDVAESHLVRADPRARPAATGLDRLAHREGSIGVHRADVPGEPRACVRSKAACMRACACVHACMCTRCVQVPDRVSNVPACDLCVRSEAA